MKKRTSLVFGLLAALLLPLFIFTGCPQSAGNDGGGTELGGEDGPPQKEKDGWEPAVTLFKLRGETGVTNVKLAWQKRADANRYVVYQGDRRVGVFTGDTADDYGLGSGGTYSYTIKAYKDSTLVILSEEVSATTFTPETQPLSTWTNGNTSNPSLGGNGTPQPGGFKFGDTYYDYGTTASNGIITVRERTSPDGFNWSVWRNLTQTIPDLTLTPDIPTAKLEGVGWHKVGNKVVLTAHREESGSTYNAGHFFLASITPGGEMEITFDGRPFNNQSRDQSIFVDNDGAAYALGGTTTDMYIYKLDPDWREPVEVTNHIYAGTARETPTIMRIGGTYYFFSSKQSGWYPSQTAYGVASDIAGEWSDLYEIGNVVTFGCQYNYIAPYGTERQTYGLYGYRWANQFPAHTEGANSLRLTTLSMSNSFATAEYFSEIEYYPDYGLVGVQPGQNLSFNARATASSTSAAAANADVAMVIDGADLASSGHFMGAAIPYNIVVDLRRLAKIREINLSTRNVGGSEGAFKYTIDASINGKDYTQIVDASANWVAGFTIHKISNTTSYRFVRLNVTGILNVNNSDANIASWADGIIELAIFGAPEW
jgi:hypothetical protein